MIPLGIEIPLFVVQLQCLYFSPLSANHFRHEYPVPCLRLTLNSSPTSEGFRYWRASEICSRPAISASTMQQLLSDAISGFKVVAVQPQWRRGLQLPHPHSAIAGSA